MGASFSSDRPHPSTDARRAHSPSLRNGTAQTTTRSDRGPAKPNGTIERLGLRTGKLLVWARGLTTPDGLVILPNGDAVVSRDIGVATGLTVFPPATAAIRRSIGRRVDDMSVDPSGILYIAGFESGRIYRLNPSTHASCAIASGLAQPTSARLAARVGRPGISTSPMPTVTCPS